jgi:hypothetical protein
MRYKPSSRTVFYHLQDLGLVKASEYNKYCQATVYARLGWTDSNGELIYPKLDIDCFSDNSRLTVNAYDASEPEEPQPPGPIEDPTEYIQYEIRRLKRAPFEYDGVGDYGEDGQIGGRWYGQPEYVEVWEEKNDLIEGFKEILKDKHVNIRANKGYSSLEFLFECTQKLKELIEVKGLEPEDITILYFGDWDPSGANIDYYIKKRLKQLGISGINFERVAVTPEQIDKYDLPLMPIEQIAEEKKASNPNLKEFKRLYGDKATHLNAFFTEAHIDDFKKIACEAVDEHYDESIYDDMIEEYDVEAEDPPSLSEEELEEARREMYRQITEAFRPGWESSQ